MIPYVRAINYLSPSSLRQMEEKPVEFYFRRLGPAELAPPRELQSYPAAVGTIFDARVKVTLSKQLSIPCASLDYMMRETRLEHLPAADDLGRACLTGYIKCGAYDELLREKPISLGTINEDFAPGTNVPIQTKIDALTMYGGKLTVHDWKVLGSNSPGERSPTAGYAKLWDTDRPGEIKQHDRYGETMDAIDEDWATQLSIYGWASGKPVADTFGSIDQVIVGAAGRIRVAQFRAVLTAEFQRKVIARLVDAWQRIKDELVIPPEVAAHGLELARVML